MIKSFAEDVLDGLTAPNKYLKSCYLYNAKGDRLFQEKMAMDEYYLTNCEYEIFSNYKDVIADIFSSSSKKFNLIEFGAGDGHKTKILLESLLKNNRQFTYIPIDISENILKELKSDLISMYPKLDVSPISSEYIVALRSLTASKDKCKNVVLFIGSTIGNFSPLESESFLSEVAHCLNDGDIILIGFDMKKSPQLIRDAYTLGANELFYKNILERINEELGGDFNLADFEHYFSYNPLSGLGETFLISRRKHIVKLSSVDTTINFNLWEPIHISVHHKYDDEYINELAKKTGFRVVATFYDGRKYFSDSVWQLKSDHRSVS